MEQDAINFFENEIEQFNIALNGVMRPEYKTYIENKKAFYEIALNAIKSKKENETK